MANVEKLLTEIQQNLFDRAMHLREQNTRVIDNREEFIRYFTPNNEDKPELHGGFAICHYAEDPAVEKLLSELKVTIRCIPLEGEIEGSDAGAGQCIFTGKPSERRAVFAKAY